MLEEKPEDDEKPSAKEIKHDLQVVERELNNLVNFHWKYAKRMLKFGSAAWILGLAIFVSALILYRGPELILDAPAISLSLIIGAAAAPITITAVLLKRYQKRIKRLERIRQGLLSEYESSLLGKMEEDISK
ncbi:MAG: hypothetical protein KGY45_02680 [Hadesarchaea archaeon]|nr:hypothetical protein [Hadesarchaea archaeon]